MYIGEASAATGATIKAIRLYEKLGLLNNVVRENSYRVYSEEDILLIKLIKVAQKAGFKLSEINKIVSPDDGLLSWESIRKELDNKVSDIEKEIAVLQDKKARLEDYNREIAACLAENENCAFPEIRKTMP